MLKLPNRMAYDSSKGEVFVTNTGDNTVSVISDATNAVVATVAVGSSPIGITYDSDKGAVFVINDGSDTVSVISDNTNRLVATVNVGSAPYAAVSDNFFAPYNPARTSYASISNALEVDVLSQTSGVPQFPIASLNPILLIAMLLPALLIMRGKFRARGPRV